MTDLPFTIEQEKTNLRIQSGGNPHSTKITLNGQEVAGITKIVYTIDASNPSLNTAAITVECAADIDVVAAIEAEAAAHFKQDIDDLMHRAYKRGFMSGMEAERNSDEAL